MRHGVVAVDLRNVGREAFPFIRIGLDARRRGDFPLLFSLFDRGDGPARIDQTDLGYILLFNLESFFLGLFLFLAFLFSADFREVNVTAKDD